VIRAMKLDATLIASATSRATCYPPSLLSHEPSSNITWFSYMNFIGGSYHLDYETEKEPGIETSSDTTRFILASQPAVYHLRPLL
jgi:hypothetical protein